MKFNDMNEKQLNLFDFDDYSIFSLIQNEFLPHESYEIEYKSGKDGFPKELWKSYSAFANTNTGIIVIGIQEKGNSLIVHGLSVQQIEKYKKEFWDGCNNLNTVSRNLLENKDIKTVLINNKTVLAIRVPFASRTERPIFLTRNPFGNTYKRNHEGDYRCTDEEVRRMIADSSAELKKDSLILENYTTDDLDSLSIEQYRQLFRSSFSNHPWHALDNKNLLTKLGAIRKDRQTGIEGVTLAGLLMFGKYDSIREQEELPDFFPDFREHLSIDNNIRWTNRIYPDGTWETNLLQFYLKVWTRLSGTLPKPFQLKDDERLNENLAHVALREAFVNALIHTDYSQSGNIVIELFTEKFVFSNPGTLLISLEQYYAGGTSECRNPSLQQMFMFIGRAEKAGSGVDKIMEGWRYAHWRPPFLEIETKPDRVKLTMPMFSIIPENVLEQLQVKYDDLSLLTPDELSILYVAFVEGSISNHRLQYMINKHPVDITVLLKKMCVKNYLESDNKGRWTTYRLKGKLTTPQVKVDTSDEYIDNKADTNKELTTPQAKVDTPQVKVDTSDENIDNKADTNKELTTPQAKVDTPQVKVDTSPRKIATRLSKVELENLIMYVCKEDYIKMEDVAKTIERSEDYLKNKIFPKMIKEGKLKKRFPYTHNHPGQGYKTSKELDNKSIKNTTPQVTPQVKDLILAINGELNRNELQKILKLTDREYFRKTYLVPALDLALIEMTQPNSPNSPTQKYRLTEKGANLKKQIKNKQEN